MHDFICPGCNSGVFSESLNYLAEADEFRHKKIVTCQQCNLKSIFPMPTAADVEDYYSKYWEKHNVKMLNKLFEAQARSRHEFIEDLMVCSARPRVLDVGAGFGLIKQHFGNRIEYDAVEIDPIAIEFLNNSAKAKNIYSSVDATVGVYDLIILSHIIEHFREPLDFMCKIREKLTDSGIVFVEVPNKDYTYKTRNEPHLIFFDPETLTSLVKKSELNIIKCQTCGMKISDLKENSIDRLSLVKKFIKNNLPYYVVQKILEYKRHNYASKFDVSYVSQYGDDRQWIRLVANRLKA